MQNSDYVKVVRCKDCKKNPDIRYNPEYNPSFNACPYDYFDGMYRCIPPSGDWYCADGERKDNHYAKV